MRYFLGIDNGGTMTKAAVFDEKGREIAVDSRPTPVKRPCDGQSERDMELLWKITAECIRSAIEKSGVPPESIVSVGLSGHGKGLYLWGKNGRPVRPAISSTDRRAEDIVARWEKDGTAKAAAELTLQKVIACQPVALLRWLKENEPQSLEKIRWIFSCKDYIRFRLTSVAMSEFTDLSGTSLMNLGTMKPDMRLNEIFGIREISDCIPPLCSSCDNAGSVTEEAALLTGLRPGTVVSGGMFDIDACAVAMGVFDPEKLCTVTGTWSINEYPSSVAVPAESGTSNSIFCVPDKYLVEESSPTSAGNLEWFLENFMKSEGGKSGSELYEAVDGAVDGISPEESQVIFLPFLYGANAGCGDAVFAGVTERTKKKHLLRAIYEGVAFSHRWHIERLLRFRERPQAIRMAGGAVNSPVWVQMFADVLSIPIETVTVKQLGALGVSMAAAVAAGVYPDLETAAENMIPTVSTVTPSPERAKAYEIKYRRYLSLIKRMEGF